MFETPTDMPEVIIVVRQGSKFGFWLRVRNEVGDVLSTPDLTSQTLPGAYHEAIALGYTPTHWMGSTGLTTIPDSIK